MVICPGYSQICEKAAMAEEYGEGELLTHGIEGGRRKEGPSS